MTKSLRFVTMILACALTMSAVGEAAVPQLINYQGRLTNSFGVPLDTIATIDFVIYKDSLGTMDIWTESHASVTIQKGLFQVLLGSTSPLTLAVFDGSKRWLGVQLAGGSAPSELIPIVSAAYAYRAIKSDTASYSLGGDNASGWTDSGNTLRLQNASDSVGVGTNTPTAKIDAVGSIRARDSVIAHQLRLGSSTQDGALNVYQSGSSVSVVSIVDDVAGGGQVWLRDEAGHTTHNISADANGTGGYLDISRSATESGFMVDGNYSSSNEPLVSITGSSRSAIFDMSASGDSSVMLPSSSISSSETGNEAGMAWTSRSTGSVTLGGTPTTILSRNCFFPSSGHVLVIATFYYDFWHISGTSDQFTFGVSDVEGSFPANQGFRRNYSPNWSTFNYQEFSTVQAHYSVDAGIETFYILGEAIGATSPWAGDAHLSVLFLPTGYNWNLTQGYSNSPEQSEVDVRIEAKIAAESERLRKEFEDKLRTIEENFRNESKNGDR
jgi:hypothetical protein